MGLELITMDAEDSDWKEIFRQALLDASRSLAPLALGRNTAHGRDVADMIIVLDPEYVERSEVLATISDIRAYGFRSLTARPHHSLPAGTSSRTMSVRSSSTLIMRTRSCPSSAKRNLRRWTSSWWTRFGQRCTFQRGHTHIVR
jgi:hypothetical protein